MNKTSLTTISGKLIDLVDPQPDQIDIDDIAHALSMLCRFNGHTNRFYSVAEHSVRVANTLLKIYHDMSPLCDYEIVVAPKHAVLYALLHDAHKAYVGDITRLLKRAIKPEYGWSEQPNLDSVAGHIQGLIHDKYIDPEWSPSVALSSNLKMADYAMSVVEGQCLLPQNVNAVGDANEQEMKLASGLAKVACWEPQTAKAKFMFCFERCEDNYYADLTEAKTYII